MELDKVKRLVAKEPDVDGFHRVTYKKSPRKGKKHVPEKGECNRAESKYRSSFSRTEGDFMRHRIPLPQEMPGSIGEKNREGPSMAAIVAQQQNQNVIFTFGQQK